MRKYILQFIVLTAFIVQAESQNYITEYTNALNAFEEEKYSEAILLLNSALEDCESSYSYRIIRKRGVCYKRMQEYDSAVSDFKILLKMAKQVKDNQYIQNNYWAIGNLYSMKGKFINKSKYQKKSLKYYLKANKYEYDKSSLFSTIGYQMIVVGKTKKSIKYLNRSLEIDRKNGLAYSNRALAYAKTGNADAALSDADKAVELMPENPYAYKHRALAYLLKGEREKACEDLHKASELGFNQYFFANDISVDELIKQNCK